MVNIGATVDTIDLGIVALASIHSRLAIVVLTSENICPEVPTNIFAFALSDDFSV
jgi:hypothetical protein